MKKIFYSHPDIILALLALIFLGILISFYSWGFNDIFLQVHRALVAAPSETGSSFDLEGASKLDLRGVGSSTPSAPAAVSGPMILATGTQSSASTTPTTTLQ